MSVEPHERFPTPPAPGADAGFEIAGRRVRPDLQRVQTPDGEVTLEPKVMRVLRLLAANPGAVVTKEELFREVWEGAYVTEDVLTRAISELRRVFGDDAARPRVIETIRKSGYRLIAPIAPLAPVADSEPRAGDARAATRIGSPRRPASIAAAAAIAAVIAGAIWWLARPRPAPAPMRIHSLTALPGNERDPALSPDGTRVAFAWNGGGTGEAMSLYVRLVDGETLLRLTHAPDVEDRTPEWSPDGKRLAFTRATAAGCRILLVSSIGGEERPVAPCGDPDYRRLAWSPDARWLAVSRRASNGALAIELLSPDTLARRAVTTPPAGILGDTSPAFSPDGKTLAFTRNVTDGVGDIFRVPVAGGAPTRLTFDDRDTMGAAWAPDGRSLVFSSSRAGIYSLWRVAAKGGEPTWVAGGALKLKHPSAARSRALVAYENWLYEVNLWRVPTTGGLVPPGNGVRLTQSADEWNFNPNLSPDGRTVAFVSTRSGSDEVWTVGADGSGERRLTSFGGARLEAPRWSPDGRRLVLSGRGRGGARLYLVAAEGGVAREIPTGGGDAVAPSWSRDGASIYFAARDRFGAWQLSRFDERDSGVARITASGGYAARESPDGGFLYYTRADAAGIWRRPLGAPPDAAAERVTDRLAPEDWANWELGRSGIYFRELCARHPGLPAVAFLAYGASMPVDLVVLPEQGWSGFAVSPAGDWIVYARADRHTCDVRAIENPI